MLRDHELGSEAVEYMKVCLAQGHTLAKHLLELPLREGRIFAPLPDDVGKTAQMAFAFGGITSRGETEPHLAAYISTYLNGESRRCAVFEDALAKPADPFLASSKAQFVVFQSEVYHYLNAPPPDSRRIIASMRAATSHLFLGALSAEPTEQSLQPRKTVQLDTIITLVQNVRHILVGAYDGEGALIWSRR